MSKYDLNYQMEELKRIRKMTGLNRTQFCRVYEIPLRSMEQWEAGQRKMPDYVLRLLSYKVLSQQVLQKQQYYDCDSRFECSSFLANGRSVMPAGTTIYSMPIKSRKDEYCQIRQECDIAFVFDDMIIEPAFYSVPRFDIMAIDSKGGYLGMLGNICDLEDGRPVYYIDAQWNTYQVAKDGHDFIQNMKEWKENLVPTDDMSLFTTKNDAKQVFSFVEVTSFQEESEGIHDK